MIHYMRLQKVPFQAIMKGKKNIELRLNDEKRQQIQEGDQIVFKLFDSDEKEITATVDTLYHAESFAELFSAHSLYGCGFKAGTDVAAAVKSMRKYYTEEEEQKYGVLGIQLSDICFLNKWNRYPTLSHIYSSKWNRMYNHDWTTTTFFTITTDRFIIRITGGSVKFFDIEKDKLIHANKGFNYLYTGDVKPDESELMALENGNHFYIFSLKDFSQIKKVTLPDGYSSIDKCGRYSEDGSILYIPVSYGDLCLFETENYTYLRIEKIPQGSEWNKWFWPLSMPKEYYEAARETNTVDKMKEI